MYKHFSPVTVHTFHILPQHCPPPPNPLAPPYTPLHPQSMCTPMLYSPPPVHIPPLNPPCRLSLSYPVAFPPYNPTPSPCTPPLVPLLRQPPGASVHRLPVYIILYTSPPPPPALNPTSLIYPLQAVDLGITFMYVQN